MPVIVIANPKGGVGKSTLSTSIAAYFASQGRSVMLGDVDRQQSSKLWLSLRPDTAAPIQSWEVGRDEIAKPPKGITHVVLDTPAGLHGKRLQEVLKRSHKLLVPLQASVFDMTATLQFLGEVADHSRQLGKMQVALVGLRVDDRTRMAEQLRQFVERTGLTQLATLRNTQNYPLLAARGLTIFDVPASQAQRDLDQWAPICRWLDS
jgi:chromosome partitioning protein